MKTTTCAFCGKEIKKGLFGIGGNGRRVSLSMIDMDCCPECYQTYKTFIDREGRRFDIKLRNAFRRANVYPEIEKLLTKEEIAAYFLAYYHESKAYGDRKKTTGCLLPLFCAKSELNCAFLTKEAALSCAGTPVGIVEAISDRLRKATDEQTSDDLRPFGSEDISCLEYACSEKEDLGEQIAQKIYIKLNDFRQVTYKPCVLEGVVTYPVYLNDDYVDERIAEIVRAIGLQLDISHLPIVKRTENQLYNAGCLPTTKKGTQKERDSKLRKFFD